jgi:hypothetical protein
LNPDDIHDTGSLLPLSDTAAYVLAAGGLPKTFYHNLTYALCPAQGLHTLTEEVRGKFSHVNKPISSEKKLFVQAPCRVATLEETLPETQRPSHTALTR